MDFTLDQLRILDAIARTGSFANAAAEQHRVPSAVTYAVKSLEDALGVMIFDRSHRRAELTPAGHRILESVRAVLAQVWSLEQVVAELTDGWEPELRVVVDGALPMGPVNRCLRRFTEEGVATRLRIDVEYQEGVLDRFEQDKADLALTLGFDEGGNDRGYDCTPLPDLELVLVAAPHHPLVLRPGDRDKQAELVVRDSSPRFVRAPKGSILGSRTVVYLSDFHSKRLALLEGAGFGWIPLHLVHEDLARQALVRLSLDGPSQAGPSREGPSQWTYHPQAIVQPGKVLGRAGRLFMQTLLGQTEREGQS